MIHLDSFHFIAHDVQIEIFIRRSCAITPRREPDNRVYGMHMLVGMSITIRTDLSMQFEEWLDLYISKLIKLQRWPRQPLHDRA